MQPHKGPFGGKFLKSAAFADVRGAAFTRPEGTMTKLEGPPLKGEFIALVEMLEKPSV
jgi:hypothetical protein